MGGLFTCYAAAMLRVIVGQRERHEGVEGHRALAVKVEEPGAHLAEPQALFDHVPVFVRLSPAASRAQASY